ncbi:flavodoxin domain-containing protein [Saccharophagus degradans]|uniref:Flavodoxin/nitric oxide synthase n=1 Tax=Saccharophagus degradans (strain 2-40 / ATCC 43961 / DSM 17024) TaxID=203122 RepID=Q21KP4_SACD2|nr:flavodoxin domain-containing protein [Saccharophagus degradans]ABD80735.1 flavodoxin/nitric oxide synthase [Saccharophagus degradans 2-40]MBU2987284.1 flavodoxin domain-containing protein [Saccharophagus degradans]
MSRPVHIVVGSVMGTALNVATEVAKVLETLGHNVRISPAFDGNNLYQTEDEVLLICTSNTGMGDLPENILPLYALLTQTPPNIAGRHYGLINLGDSSYPNFAQAGTTLDEAMADIGATRVGTPCVLDAIYVDEPEEEACDWAKKWAQLL